MFCLTAAVAATMSGMLPQTSVTPAVDHLICNIAEHHHLVRLYFL